MKKAIFAVVLAGVLCGAAWAQFQGKIGGIVKDAAGNPLDKAEITIVSTRTSSSHIELKTDKDGKFFQIGLMPGYYQLSAKKAGFLPKSTEVHIGVAGEVNLEITLDTADQVIMKAVSEADGLFLKGSKLYSEQQYAEAAAAYEEAIAKSQTNWAYYFNLGQAYKKLDKREEALAAFTKAAELNAASYSANKEAGEALARKGSFQEAKAYYEKAITISPDDPDAHFNLGVCLLNTGESETALGHFQKTIELKADYADAYYQAGTIYIGQNKVPEAIQNLEKFLALAPDHEKASVAKQLLEYLKK